METDIKQQVDNPQKIDFRSGNEMSALAASQINYHIMGYYPITIGPYMNDPDLINNKKQLSLAMGEAYKVLPEIYNEYAKLSGRSYNMVECYRTDDADAILFILNSAAETALGTVDKLRKEGKKVGLVYLTVIRPFPAKKIAAAMKNAKAVLVG